MLLRSPIWFPAGSQGTGETATQAFALRSPEFGEFKRGKGLRFGLVNIRHEEHIVMSQTIVAAAIISVLVHSHLVLSIRYNPLGLPSVSHFVHASKSDGAT